MVQKTKTTQASKKQRQKKSKRPHQFRSYLNEIRPIWKNTPDKVIPMMEDMIIKKARYLFDRIILLDYIQRFLEIHEYKIRKVKSAKFDEVYNWVFLYKLDTNAEIYNWLRMQKYIHKFWLNDELQLEYLRKEIKERSGKLRVNHPSDEKRSRLYEIYSLLIDGEFPDLEKYDLIEISIIIAEITFIDFLKQEEQQFSARQHPKTFIVPVELTTPSKTGEHSLQVKIPQGFFEKIQKEILHKELENLELPKNRNVPEPKFYTRQETAKIMNVSLNTVDKLTKEGTLKCHRIKGTSMKRYKWEDIDNALDVMEMRLNKRFGR